MIFNTEIGSNSRTWWGHVPYHLICHVSRSHDSDQPKIGPDSTIMYAGLTMMIKLHCPAANKRKFSPSPVEIQSHAALRQAFRRTPLQDHTKAEVDVDSDHSRLASPANKHHCPRDSGSVLSIIRLVHPCLNFTRLPRL